MNKKTGFILNIGSELTEGHILNKNGFWLAQQLKKEQLHVQEISTIPDGKDELWRALQNIPEHIEFVILTGGLGPTKDDQTRFDFAAYFGLECIFSEVAAAHVQKIMPEHMRHLVKENSSQCFIPQGAEILENMMGTACGMYAFLKNKHYFLLPGVPYEMKHLFETQVKSRLPKLVQYEATREILTQGIGESLQNKLLENVDFSDPYDFASLPSAKGLLVRIKAFHKELAQAEILAEKKKLEVLEAFAEYSHCILSIDKTSVLEQLSALLLARSETITVAESCTGGGLGSLLTEKSGASAYFLGGVMTYSNALKSQLLGVDAQVIERFGAVSEECALQMAMGCATQLKSDWAISVTGIAGPDGGSDEKPVGCVYVGVFGPQLHAVKRFILRGDRNEIRERAVQAAMQFCLENLKLCKAK
jgi:nicotinamide-nucleotide amidase